MRSPALDEKIVADVEKNYGDKLRAALDTTGKDKLSSLRGGRRS